MIKLSKYSQLLNCTSFHSGIVFRVKQKTISSYSFSESAAVLTLQLQRKHTNRSNKCFKKRQTKLLFFFNLCLRSQKITKQQANKNFSLLYHKFKSYSPASSLMASSLNTRLGTRGSKEGIYTCSFEYGAIMETTFLLKLWASQVEFCFIPLPGLNPFWPISYSYPHLYIYKI